MINSHIFEQTPKAQARLHDCVRVFYLHAKQISASSVISSPEKQSQFDAALDLTKTALAVLTFRVVVHKLP